MLSLLDEAFRHGKAIGNWGDADAVLTRATLPGDAPGLVGAGSAAARATARSPTIIRASGGRPGCRKGARVPGAP
ncbi:hypothetical protein ACF08E_09065 [Streptomyces globisporus]|uniref:hypothetical protein n=1 Tax=Streptomyces globisporus TaxID=1908 RepID=UPI0036FB7938